MKQKEKGDSLWLDIVPLLFAPKAECARLKRETNTSIRLARFGRVVTTRRTSQLAEMLR